MPCVNGWMKNGWTFEMKTFWKIFFWISLDNMEDKQGRYIGTCTSS